MVTKGHRARRLGRAIRRMEASVELSAKETKAMVAEKEYKQKKKAASGYAEDYPVENLREPSKAKG